MLSVDFQGIEQLLGRGAWDEIGSKLVNDSRKIEAAGADFLLICTNTMHRLAPQIEEAIQIPLLHIADATAKRITEQRIHTVGLLGTRFTMEQSFYKGRLQDTHGLEVVVPPEKDRDIVHQIIFDELCLGKVVGRSRRKFLSIMENLRQAGAQMVIEGCTEIGMLVDQTHTDIPLLDTTVVHAETAVDWSLAG
jgi:aspartate racemase